jgi:hypothetical protein
MPILNHKDRDRGPEAWRDIRAHIRYQHKWRCECVGSLAAAPKADNREGLTSTVTHVGAHPNVHGRKVEERRRAARRAAPSGAPSHGNSELNPAAHLRRR